MTKSDEKEFILGKIENTVVNEDNYEDLQLEGEPDIDFIDSICKMENVDNAQELLDLFSIEDIMLS